MKRTFTIVLLFGFYALNAQQVVIDVNNENKNVAYKEITYTVGGQIPVKYVDFKDGSPFFKEEWLTSSLTLNNGKSFNGLPGKLDIMAGNFLYKDEKGTELVAQAPIKQIVLTENNNPYIFLNASSLPGLAAKKGWYQQLQTGKVSLYRQFEKTIVEQRPYNSATVEQFIKTTEKYYLLKDQTLIPIKKTKDLLEALSNKAAELEKFKKEKSNSPEKTYVQIVSYYNSLFK
jgi:hypothetical protein